MEKSSKKIKKRYQKARPFSKKTQNKSHQRCFYFSKRCFLHTGMLLKGAFTFWKAHQRCFYFSKRCFLHTGMLLKGAFTFWKAHQRCFIPKKAHYSSKKIKKRYQKVRPFSKSSPQRYLLLQISNQILLFVILNDSFPPIS